MQEKIKWFGSSINTGHGNPQSVLAAIEKCRVAGEQVYISHGRMAGRIASIGHSLMRRYPLIAHNYSPEIRKSKVAKVIGLIAWIENFACNEPLRQSHNRDENVLIATQELALWPFALFPHFLDTYFPSGRRYLLIPDTHPKPNLPSLLKSLDGQITPVAYTRRAGAMLNDRGIGCRVTSPWMYPGRVVNTNSSIRETIIFKVSGSGGPENLINNTVASTLRDHPDARFHVIHPDRTETFDGGRRSTHIHSSIQDAYRPFLQPNITEIISPASEIIGIAAAMKLAGWMGIHKTVVINGSHEEDNYHWGVMHGVTEHHDPALRISSPLLDVRNAVGSAELSAIIRPST